MLMSMLVTALSVLGLSGSLTFTQARADNVTFRARLSGFQEVTPKLTDAQGSLTAVLKADSISYKLTYTNMTSATLFSHFHFGQPGVNGGVYVFLCGGGGKPACPSPGGTVMGTITAADILAVPDQGINAGDFSAAVRALRSGDTYANVHSTRFPSGEIRGQLMQESDRDDASTNAGSQ